MTKNVKLTQAYINIWKDPKGMNRGLASNGKCFFTYNDPASKVGGESTRGKDIAADPSKVPIYDLSTAPNPKNVPEEDLPTYIIRYEGSNATPPTIDVECYGCDEETISMPTALADAWITAGVMEEVT